MSLDCLATCCSNCCGGLTPNCTQLYVTFSCEKEPSLMHIQFTWSPSGDINACDFDARIDFLSVTNGWPAGNASPYVSGWTNVTLCGTGEEQFFVDLEQAYCDGQWLTSVDIPIYGDWRASRPNAAFQTDFSVEVRVTWLGITDSKIFSSPPAGEEGTPTTFFITVTAFNNGTWSW